MILSRPFSLTGSLKLVIITSLVLGVMVADKQMKEVLEILGEVFHTACKLV